MQSMKVGTIEVMPKSGPYLSDQPLRNAHLQNVQQLTYFSISVQLAYWIFSSPEAFCDT